MSEAQELNIDWLDTPCQSCGAVVGQVCADDCELAQESFVEVSNGDEWLQGEIDEFKQSLMAPLYRLPFVGSFLQPPDYRGRTTDGWLAELGIWLDQYNQFAKRQVSDLQIQSRRAMALQLEKDIVRQFFTGVAPTTTQEVK